MPAGWIAAFKAVLPYVDPIVQVVTPVFTRRRIDSITSQADLLQKQIDELQEAAEQNATHIKELAAQLKQVVVALDQAAVNLEAANRRHWTLSILAVVLAAASLGAVLAVALAR